MGSIELLALTGPTASPRMAAAQARLMADLSSSLPAVHARLDAEGVSRSESQSGVVSRSESQS
eukprot:2886520-Prymnesium_polylepis.1